MSGSDVDKSKPELRPGGTQDASHSAMPLGLLRFCVRSIIDRVEYLAWRTGSRMPFLLFQDRMAYCCVPHCRSHGKRTAPELSFHEIPADWDLRESWIRAIGRDNWVPNTTSNYSKVCSKHFKETDFIEGKRRRLVKGVVPSVFEDSCGAKKRNGGRVRKTCCSDNVHKDCVGGRKVQKRSEGAERQVEAPAASPPSSAGGDEAANEPTESTAADLERGESRSPQNIEEETPSGSSQGNVNKTVFKWRGS